MHSVSQRIGEHFAPRGMLMLSVNTRGPNSSASIITDTLVMEQQGVVPLGASLPKDTNTVTCDM